MIDKGHEYAKLIEEEMKCYREAEQTVLEDARADEDYGNLGKHGRPSTHIFVGCLAELVNELAEEREAEALKMLGTLKEIEAKFDRCGLEDATTVVGTFKVQKGQKMIKLVIAGDENEVGGVRVCGNSLYDEESWLKVPHRQTYKRRSFQSRAGRSEPNKDEDER